MILIPASAPGSSFYRFDLKLRLNHQSPVLYVDNDRLSGVKAESFQQETLECELWQRVGLVAIGAVTQMTLVIIFEEFWAGGI